MLLRICSLVNTLHANWKPKPGAKQNILMKSLTRAMSSRIQGHQSSLKQEWCLKSYLHKLYNMIFCEPNSGT